MAGPESFRVELLEVVEHENKINNKTENEDMNNKTGVRLDVL